VKLALEIFGAQQGCEHVDRHGGGRGDVEDGDDHGQIRVRKTA
jgi:hypothetical protein